MLSLVYAARATDTETSAVNKTLPPRSRFTTSRPIFDQRILGLIALVDNLHDGVLALDRAGRCVHANEAFRTLFDIDQNDDLSDTPIDVLLNRGSQRNLQTSWFGPMQCGDVPGETVMLMRVAVHPAGPRPNEMQSMMSALAETLSMVAPAAPCVELAKRCTNLSAREREILTLVCEGKRTTTMAEILFLSEHTVRNHLKRLYRKLGVHSVAELRELGPESLRN